MDNQIKELLKQVKVLIGGKGLRRIIEDIRETYDKDTDIENGFGHALSRTDIFKFEAAVKRRTNDQKENFRQLINRLMFEKDMSQSTLSKRSLIKESTLSRYINGSREPSADMLFRIALSLSLNLNETDTLLRKVGRGFQETPKHAVVIEAIRQQLYDVVKVEAVLRHLTHGEQSLFTKIEQEEFLGTDRDWEIEII